MTFNQITYFITVAESLNITEASKSLFLTQPALSRQISSMEDELGTQLFIRGSKQLKLTPGGVLLRNRFREIMVEYHQAVADAKTANLGYTGDLKIGFFDIYDISEIFPDVIAAFSETYPQIHLTLERHTLDELPQKLYDGSLDLILTYNFSLYDQPQLVTTTVQKFDSCILLSKSHPLAGKSSIALTDLAGETFAQLRASVCEEGTRYIHSLFQKSNMHPQFIWADKVEDILLWIQTNKAVSITTNRTTEHQNPSVIVLPIDMDEAKGHNITMAWHKTNYNPAISIFMELLDQHIEL